jgi:hypothetical protein
MEAAILRRNASTRLPGRWHGRAGIALWQVALLRALQRKWNLAHARAVKPVFECVVALTPLVIKFSDPGVNPLVVLR